jgi:hypothetical protein
MFAARGYLAFTVENDGALTPIDWPAAVAIRQLTNLVLLPPGDPLAM